ncbi:hypothetical protein [Paludibacterium yongneupense]|uniref:hypothetical protein n=1 Tax=Paludibacterium yongneupense TaxID=400061 RepID=UPI000491F557|nr:hypothetical protein [Paludibacterium yongneupense]
MKRTLLFLFALPLSGACGAEPVTAPVFRPGDNWVLRTLDGYKQDKELSREALTVKSIRNGLVIYEIRSGDTIRQGASSIDYNPVSVDAQHHLQVRKHWQWPLEPGKRYDYPVDDANITRASVEVGQMEKITTPAGRFDAIKVTTEGGWRNNSGRGATGRWVKTEWYAPAAKWVVRSEYRDYSSKGDIANWIVTEAVSVSAD